MHLLGLVMFLGSIIGYIVVNGMSGKSANLEVVSFAKDFVYLGTRIITVPGMWILILTGIILSYSSGYKIGANGWLKAKLLISLFIILNATFLIVPATKELAHIAADSVVKVALNPNMSKFQMKEDIFGTINVIGILVNLILVIYFRKAIK
jgi:uncharacterized membrane protein